MTRMLPAQSTALADHVHARVQPGSVDSAAIEDEAVTFDKVAAGVKGGTPATIDPDDSASNGSASAFALADHQHPITTGTPAALTLTGTSAEGAGTGFARDTHVHSTAALPWGVVAYQELTTDESSPHSASAVTDMVLSDVVVSADRVYRVHLQAQWAIVGSGVWTMDFRVDGVVTNRFATSPTRFIGSSFLWFPTTGTKELDVFATEASGTATSQLTAVASATRQFWVEDIGPR